MVVNQDHKFIKTQFNIMNFKNFKVLDVVYIRYTSVNI